MPFAVKDLPFAKDALDGISAQTIETHHDKLYPGYVNKRNEIEAALPNAAPRVTVEDCGHNLTVERPAVLLEEVRTFLRGRVTAPE